MFHLTKNNKTTLVGAIAVLASFVATYPKFFGGPDTFIVDLCQFLSVGGGCTMLIGLFAKDA